MTTILDVFAGDVVAQMFNEQLLLGDDRLDNVTDGDNTDEGVIVEYGEMTDFFACTAVIEGEVRRLIRLYSSPMGIIPSSDRTAV